MKLDVKISNHTRKYLQKVLLILTKVLRTNLKFEENLVNLCGSMSLGSRTSLTIKKKLTLNRRSSFFKSYQQSNTRFQSQRPDKLITKYL